VTTTLPAPETHTAVVEQTRLRALALQLEFVLRYTADVEWWLPQVAHGLETHWLAVKAKGITPDNAEDHSMLPGQWRCYRRKSVPFCDRFVPRLSGTVFRASRHAPGRVTTQGVLPTAC
jgi:hypothetical protein